MAEPLKHAVARWGRTFPMWKQGELSPECGPYCVLALAEYLGSKDVWDEDYPLRWVTPPKGELSRGTSRRNLTTMLRKVKLVAETVSEAHELVSDDSLGLVLVRWKQPTPKVGSRRRDRKWDPKRGHYVVVLEVRKRWVVVADPYPGLPRVYPAERHVFEEAWRKLGRWGVRVSSSDKTQRSP